MHKHTWTISKPLTAIIQNLKSPIRNQLLLGVVVAIAGTVGARALTSVTQVVLARVLGVANFGTFTALYALLSPLVIVAGLGLDTWLLRQGGDEHALDSAIGQVLMVRLGSLVVLSVVVSAALLAAGWPPLAVPVLLAAFGLGCEFLITTAAAALRAQVRNVAATMIQIMVAAVWLGLVWQAWVPVTPLLAATGYRCAAAALGAVVVVWLLRAQLTRRAWQAHSLWDLVIHSRAFFVADLLASVALRADLVLIALLIGEVGAGIYSPALTIINASFLVPYAVWTVVLPLAVRQRSNAHVLQRLVWLLLGISVLFGTICALVFGIGAAPLIALIFGPQYGAAVPLLQIMAFVPLFKSISFCWALIMVVRDAQSLRARLLAVSTVFNIVANIVVLPLVGVVGAAWVNLTTEALLTCWYGYGAWRATRRSTDVLQHTL